MSITREFFVDYTVYRDDEPDDRHTVEVACTPDEASKQAVARAARAERVRRNDVVINFVEAR